jgi:hypothetical protein
MATIKIDQDPAFVQTKMTPHPRLGPENWGGVVDGPL